MKLKFNKIGNTITVYLSGRIDVHQSVEIEKDIRMLVVDELSGDLILNLQDVEYLSSSGIATLLSIMYKLKSKGKKFVLCNLKESILKVLDLIDMTASFIIFKTEIEAVDFLNRQRIAS